MVVQREVVPKVKALQGQKSISSDKLYLVLQQMVTMLSQDLSWMQALTAKQTFCWSIVASCCVKIPVTVDQFHLYGCIMACLGCIYNSYCNGKNLPEDKCMLFAEEVSQEITNVRKYEYTAVFSMSPSIVLCGILYGLIKYRVVLHLGPISEMSISDLQYTNDVTFGL